MFTLAGVSVDGMVSDGNLIPLVAIVGGLSVAIIAIVFGCIAGIITNKQKEETKREIAAYVAEGTIDADKAIAMLNSSGSKCSKDAFS